MECTCGGVLEEGKTTHRLSGDHFSLIIDDLPAFRCMRCSKVLIGDEVAELLQRLSNRTARDVKEIVSGQAPTNLFEYK